MYMFAMYVYVPPPWEHRPLGVRRNAPAAPERGTIVFQFKQLLMFL
jgi:hypothetical protein